LPSGGTSGKISLVVCDDSSGADMSAESEEDALDSGSRRNVSLLSEFSCVPSESSDKAQEAAFGLEKRFWF